jgi:acyl-CoA synthetase (AMP-forming)/AMP-acid ligase II
VGRPVEGVEVRCIRVEDGPIAAWSADLEVPRGTPGEVCVRGPQVTRGYWGRPDADLLSKIPDPAGGFWHRMGDVGRLDGEGRLWFLGRKSQRVRTPEGDLYPDQVEGIFNGRAGVHRSALVGVGEPGRQVPFLFAELECGADLGLWTSPAGALRGEFGLGPGGEEPSDPAARDLRARLRHLVEANPGFLLPLHGEALPVDSRHNAKIQREALAARAARKPRGNLS